MAEPYVGEIRMFGGNFAPRGWALCDGQILAVSQNDALFSLIGTTYGGNGTSTFALPNLEGRIPVGDGHGPGLSIRTIGESGGGERVTLTTDEMPGHNHPLYATRTNASSPSVTGSVAPGQPTAGNNPAFYEGPAAGQPDPTKVDLASSACAQAGGGQSHDNIMPSLCVSFIIALFGIYPSRT